MAPSVWRTPRTEYPDGPGQSGLIQFDNTQQPLVTVLSMRINLPLHLENYWEARIAYAAGVLESEGYVAIARRRSSRRENFSLLTGINMTDAEVLGFLSETWGGNVGCYRGLRNHRPLFTWRLTGPRAAVFLTDVRPCLLTDRTRGKVQLAIAFQRHKERRRGQTKTTTDLDWEREVHRGMRLLNLRGANTLNPTERAAVIAPLLKREAAW